MYSDQDLREIFAVAPVESGYIEVITLKADWMSKSFYLQNKVTDGVDVVLETGETVTAEYAPMSLGQSSSNDDLNNERTIIFQQVNDLIATEVDKFDPDNDDMPYIQSRVYIYYRDGTVSSLKSPVVTLPVTEVSFNLGAASLTASTSPVNDTATGILYSNKRFPMQKGIS